MNRKLATTLPSRTEPAPEPQQEKLAERCEKMTRNYNRRAGTQLSPLHQGQPVWVMDHDTRKWKPATVIRIRDEPHSYVVALHNGCNLRRNRVDLRTRAKSSTDPDDQSPSSSGDMEMVISTTHKTIGHQAQTATWTDKGRLLKINVKRRPCNRRRKILVKRKTYSKRSRIQNYQSTGINKVGINYKPQDQDALSGYPNDIKIEIRLITKTHTTN